MAAIKIKQLQITRDYTGATLHLTLSINTKESGDNITEEIVTLLREQIKPFLEHVLDD